MERVAVAEGKGATELASRTYSREGTLSDWVLETGSPVRLDDAMDTDQVSGRSTAGCRDSPTDVAVVSPNVTSCGPVTRSPDPVTSSE